MVCGPAFGCQAAAAVDDDALAGDEPGALAGKEAHGLRCRREFHPPGGHRGEIGLLDVVGGRRRGARRGWAR